jgi:hypothetical protein
MLLPSRDLWESEGNPKGRITEGRKPTVRELLSSPLKKKPTVRALRKTTTRQKFFSKKKKPVDHGKRVICPKALIPGVSFNETA